MGIVWKAPDTQTGDIVALKIPWEQYATDSYFVERLEREVEVTRRIDSPYVAKTLGFGRREGRPFIAMEFIEGRSLREIIREDGAFTWAEARPILRQVALGLEAAHRAHVVHRDVKPSNIILSHEGAKLVDFGIARAEDLTALTGSKTTLGTPAYLAPEGAGSARADLYGLGCVAYEMLTGRQVFEGDTQHEVMLKHIREQPNLSPLPVAARPIVTWLLKKKPGERPSSAGQLAAVLEGTTRVPAGAAGARQGRALRSVAIAGAGFLGLGGMAFAMWAVVGGDGGDDPTPSAPETATQTPPAGQRDTHRDQRGSRDPDETGRAGRSHGDTVPHAATGEHCDAHSHSHTNARAGRHRAPAAYEHSHKDDAAPDADEHRHCDAAYIDADQGSPNADANTRPANTNATTAQYASNHLALVQS
jgi:hypothetical protein